MQRRTFAKTLAATTMIPSVALAQETPRFSRFAWGRPDEPIRPPVARGIVVHHDDYNHEYIFAAMSPSDGEKFVANYLARCEEMQRDPSRLPHLILPGIQEKFESHNSLDVTELLAPERDSDWTSIFDLPSDGVLPLWARKDGRFKFPPDHLLELDRCPDQGRARQLIEIGLDPVLVSVKSLSFLVVGSLDLTGWVEVFD